MIRQLQLSPYVKHIQGREQEIERENRKRPGEVAKKRRVSKRCEKK